MRLTIVLLTVAVLQVSASSYAQRVTLKVSNGTVKEVLSNIQDQTGYDFLYNTTDLKDAKLVTLDLTNTPLRDALDACFRNQPLSYRIDKTTVLVKRKTPAGNTIAIKDTISGIISDEKNMVIPGATIRVKGAPGGVVSNSEGKYKIVVSDNNAILSFSFIGYETQEVPINGRSSINIILKTKSSGLDEIVVVGYGTQKRGNISGSVASINTSKLEDMPVSRMEQALTGQLSGVQVLQTGGAPGDNINIVIRGIGSISADSGPLYVVDGFPISGDIATLNPSDIASIDVLKDASAAAIYGSRGSNGVVLVTTKKGASGKARIDFDSYVGTQALIHKVKVLNGDQFREYAKRARTDANGNVTNYADIDTTTANTDWQDAIYRNAIMQNYNVGLSGGKDNVQYRVSGNYFDQDGILINSFYKRYSVRANLNIKATDALTIGVSLTPTFTNKRIIDDGGRSGVITNALSMPAIFPVYNPDGSYANNFKFGNSISAIPNPVAEAMLTYNVNQNNRFLGNAFADLRITKELIYHASLGTDMYNTISDYFFPSGLTSASSIAKATSNTAFRINNSIENTLTYKKSINNTHNFSLLIGTSYQKESQQGNNINATGFANDLVPTVSGASTFGTGTTSTKSAWALVSYFTRINYDYKGKYVFAGSIRQDGSSRFGENNRFGSFPAASFAWRVSEEDFLKKINVINDLKVRVSWGQAGNFNIPNYGSIGLLNATNYVFNGSVAVGLSQTTAPNALLTWEKSAQTDVGLDLSMFKNRLSITADYFDKITKDLLLNVNTPNITGYNSYLQNLGKVRNQGFELAITTQNLKGKFSWSTNANISFIRNKVLALGTAGDPIISDGGGIASTNYTAIGLPISNFYGYVRNKVYENQAEIDNNPVKDFAGRKPGDWKTEDVNGDGKIDANDRTVIGNPFPNFTYGITNTFKYQNLDFSVLIVGSQGNKVFNLQKTLIGNFATNQNIILEQFYGFISPTNLGNGLPRAASTPSSNQTSLSTYMVEDGSYLSIKNITVGYRLPVKLSQKIHLNNARIYAGMQNAFLFTKFLGYNPEESISGTVLNKGDSYGGYPLSRQIIVGINISL